ERREMRLPNKRVQRARSSALRHRAPLTRHPLGRRGAPVALVAAGALALACTRPSLETRVAELAGPDSVNCGRVAGTEWWVATPCLVEAYAGRRPFFVRYDRQSVDSHLERAIVRTTDGRYVQLDFDSDFRGSGSWLFAKPRLFEQPCEPELAYSF